ncbi:MAG: 23S rRNA (pseudouridine(1915)-N(3))-methyltransferase RlmH [Geminicoccaceae bacterium]|nr:23S rRNA (pseudouridine(1915)-N(3))-methyltransferase RlmH [Geminicoccaceae bacterium]MCS7267398.1 23S rRNA (pseudouridine(1915)-N(3))-methyltransferase RlmH [Geminicoccaceae bacterium]MCX7629501.1 23S rRNA (pseudouridine(1915)-N(3))-methyltransferase RlmH [Geminicoccaceae bacterium]MDW8123621.1 23S rRNA (pseudouridine(1915)-N(3))-methyltransferase RlmH [Geminicoccaceae bacterium]MDW8339962.1 23S rRNA (pseudouridine(1915)-N(3))-methyltransferase RlmH [Geminicoccaceae bacterium]
MRCLVLAVGRCRDPALASLVERWRVRLPWPLEIREIEAGTGDPVRRRAEEGRALLRAVPSGAPLVALDERGLLLSSRDFAARLGRWREEGVRTVAFAIGGAEGLDPSVRERAALLLALGRMTFPHELVRLLLVEQLYRAWSILEGHPYHRD